MNNNPCIIFAIERNRLLMYIPRVSDNPCSPPNNYPYDPRHVSESVWDSHVGFATLPGAPRGPSGAPTCSLAYHNHSHCTPVPVIRDPSYSCTSHQISQSLLNQSSGMPVTLKAGRNAILGSDTLLKLTLLSLHSTSSWILLEASRD